jgi:acetyl esterase/lipase
MSENPLVKVPLLWPLANRANQLRRDLMGTMHSIDQIHWDNISYGSHPQQVMKFHELNDLCPRDGWPTVMCIHGGGWVEGDLEHFAEIAPKIAKSGFMVCSVNYRLHPKSPWPAALEDVEAALNFLCEQQVDLQRIALWGHSAGGHLALMLAKKHPQKIKAVVTIGAPTKLEDCDRDLVEDVFGTTALQIQASPFHTSLPPNTIHPKTLLLHGSKDRRVTIEQGRIYAENNSNVELYEVKDGDHGLRWPILSGRKAKRTAIQWLIQSMELPQRGSKWKRRRKKSKKK